MTTSTEIDARFERLAALSADEVITRSLVKNITLPSGAVLALVTLDNCKDHTRPNTLGPATLRELADTLLSLDKRGKSGEIQAVAITGKPYILAAGADLSKVSEIPDRDAALAMGQIGHYTLGLLGELSVPTFTFVNGLALGGGVEIALNSNYRTLDASAAAFALPEVFLGLIPGWGGAYLLPNLIGIENALKVIIENPLKNNRMLKPDQVAELGIVDALFPPVNFLEKSLAWADGVLTGAVSVKRPNEPGTIERLVKWDAAIAIARKQLEAKIGTVARSPYRALDLLKAAKNSKRHQAFAAEDEALADLISGDQFHASIYAFNLVQKRAKRPAGAPDRELASPVTKVGIIGAGLMASQFAVLFLRRLQVPVVITDVDESRVAAAITRITGELEELAQKGRINPDEFNKLSSLLSGTTDKADFAGCDWVIEAVFEELGVKQEVFAQVEPHLSPDAILATNTSSLSVDQIGARLQHPERLVGFHFFNPVAVMPLLEVVRASRTDDRSLATALGVAHTLKKSPVITSDAPGFVVNRLLAKLLGEAMYAVDNGTKFEVVNHALDPIGLPMSPFELLELVGLTVGAHVLDSMHAAFPDRFYSSENLHKLAEHGKLFERDGKGRIKGFDAVAQKIVSGGTAPLTAEEILERVNSGLAQEARIMLDSGVVSEIEDIDLAMILGAGWPFQLGGLSPYLDRIGASKATNGQDFHSPRIAGPAS